MAILEGHADFIKGLVVHGQSLYSASTDKTIRKWDMSLETPTTRTVFQGHRRGVESIVMDEEGKFLYSGSSDNSIRKWNAESGECVTVMDGHLTSVYHLFYWDGSLYSSKWRETLIRQRRLIRLQKDGM
jgi:WD40 repeat protein